VVFTSCAGPGHSDPDPDPPTVHFNTAPDPPVQRSKAQLCLTDGSLILFVGLVLRAV
jgi:hypothetical protein